MALLAGHIDYDVVTIDEYIEHSHMDRNYTWGSHTEMIVLAHMAGVNIASYNTLVRDYDFLSPGLIDINVYPEDNSRPTIYITYTGNHFNVVLSQD